MRLVCIFMLTMACAFARAAERPEPLVLARALQDLQDRVAHGDAAAKLQHATLVEEVGRAFLRSPRSVWSAPANMRAMAIYLLSGGSARVARDVRSETAKVDLAALIDGAVAYAEARADVASASLVGLDPLSLPPAVGGHLALTQGTLLAKTSVERAHAAFDIARLIGVGGVVEETALRRQAFTALQTGDFKRFNALHDRYARHYPKSGYAAEFRASVVAMISVIPPAGLRDAFPELGRFVNGLADEEQLGLYLSISLRALAAGKLDIARNAATAASTIAKDNSRDRFRAHLYRAAASLTSDRFDQAVAGLAAAPPSSLDAADRALHAAASDIARALRADPAPKARLSSTDQPPPTATMIAAENLLEASERLMQGPSK